MGKDRATRVTGGTKINNRRPMYANGMFANVCPTKITQPNTPESGQNSAGVSTAISTTPNANPNLAPAGNR